MIGLVILGLAAVGGSFATTYFLTEPADPLTIACEPEAAASATQPVKAALAPKDQRYVELDEILISIGNAPASRYLKLNATIITSSEAVNDVKKSKPLIVDAFNYYLRSVTVSDFENPAFYPHLKEQLALRAELVLGGDMARGVLITDFLLR